MGQILFAGSGWVKKKGETYIKLNQNWVQSIGGYFDSEGNFDPQRESSLFTTSFYTESGLGENLSFEMNLPLFTSNRLIITDEMGNETLNESIGGIGDVNLGIKQSLVKKDYFAMSMTYTLGVPLGSVSGGTDGTLFTGDGELNGMIRTDIGIPFGFGEFGGYFNANLGFNFRGNVFSDELLFGSELGISAFKSRFWLISRIVGIEAVQSGQTSNGNPFAGNVSFINYSVEGDMYLGERLGLSVNYVGNISGADVLITPSYNIGVFLDIK
ncbi:MAG: hypothetical protein AAF487_06690 [Bacteroidota bacterium]